MHVTDVVGNVRQTTATQENRTGVGGDTMYRGSWFIRLLMKAGFTQQEASKKFHAEVAELDAQGRVRYAQKIVRKVIRP